MIRIFALSLCFFCGFAAANEIRYCTTPPECVNVIAAKLKESTIYSEELIGKTYEAKGLIEMNSEFEIISFEILKSSGSEQFDQSIRDAVNRTQSLPELNGLNERERKMFQKITMKFKSPW